MNERKMNYAIQYIKSQPEFPFDAADVEENIQAVLAHFGIFEAFAPAELDLIQEELIPVGLAFELSEVSQAVENSENQLFADLVEPSQAERLMRKARLRANSGEIKALVEGLTASSAG